MADAPVASMPAAPSLAGVSQNTNDQQGQALAAMAKYGQAGLDAYQNAQNSVNGYRQNVLDQVAKASGIGGDAQSLLSSQVQASMAPHLADLSQGQANLQGDLALGQQQYTKYAGEAQAALPVIASQQQTQMGIRDQALQLAQQQIDAKRAQDAQAAADAHTLALTQLATQQEQTKQAQAEAAKAAAKSPDDTAKGVLGTIQAIQNNNGPGVNNPAALNSLTDISNDVMMNAEDNAAYNEPDDPNGPVKELAKLIGGQAGMSIDQIYQMLTPDELKNLTGSAAPAPAVKALTDLKLSGLDDPTAQALLNSSAWVKAHNDIPVIMNAPVKSGVLQGGPYNGLTPKAAANKYLSTLTSTNESGAADLSPAALTILKSSLAQIYGVSK